MGGSWGLDPPSPLIFSESQSYSTQIKAKNRPNNNLQEKMCAVFIKFSSGFIWMCELRKQFSPEILLCSLWCDEDSFPWLPMTDIHSFIEWISCLILKRERGQLCCVGIIFVDTHSLSMTRQVTASAAMTLAVLMSSLDKNITQHNQERQQNEHI